MVPSSVCLVCSMGRVDGVPSLPAVAFVFGASKSLLLPWKFGMTELLTLSFSILSSVSEGSGGLIGSVWGSWGFMAATFELLAFPFPLLLTFFLVGGCSPSWGSSVTAAAGIKNSWGGGTIQTSRSRPSGTEILSWAAELTELSS